MFFIQHLMKRKRQQLVDSEEEIVKKEEKQLVLTRPLRPGGTDDYIMGQRITLEQSQAYVRKELVSMLDTFPEDHPMFGDFEVCITSLSF